MASPSKRRAKLSEFEAVEGAVYLGRQRLGMFEQIDRRHFIAFDNSNSSLGVFRTVAAALAKIGNRKSLSPCSASAKVDDRAV